MIMKWFKHHSDAHTNIKTGGVIADHGMQGYGLWWLTVELIASQGEDYRVAGHKNWQRWLQRMSNMSESQLGEFLKYFAREGLIEQEALNNGDLYCPNLAEYCDDYEARRERKGGKVSPESSAWIEKVETKHPDYASLVRELAEKDYMSTKRIHTEIIEGFLTFWTEKAPTGKKARWEKEKTFDPWLRIRRWMANHHEWQGDVKCTEGWWHKKGETCHHRKAEPEIDHKKQPPSEMAKELAKKMKV